jgi:hypothetical protein
VAAVGLGAVSLFEVRCTSGGEAADDAAPFGGGPGERGRTTIRLGGSAEAGATGEALNPLCGLGRCRPETNDGCEGPSQGGAPSTGGAGGGAGGEGGNAGSAGFDAGGGFSKLGKEEASHYGQACRVREKAASCSGDCPRERACISAGNGGELAPCFASSDCGAGLACIAEGGAGLCRRYCCTSASCGDDAFCELGAEIDSELIVPVCAPLTVCSAFDAFPCPMGHTCSCGSARACSVVKNDGRTGCAVPGDRAAGDACSGFVQGECGAGFICSLSLGCLKFCQLDDLTSCESGAKCQAPADFAPGLGVCVGGTSDSALSGR